MESEDNKIPDGFPFYTIRVRDRHHIQSFMNGREKLKQRDQNNCWITWQRDMNIFFNVIVDYHEYRLFGDDNDEGVGCTKVFFQDGCYVYAAQSIDTFRKWMKENYMPVYNHLLKYYNQPQTNEDAAT
jgi:hypothetical protein